MVKEFVSSYAKMIVNNPDQIEVELIEQDKDFYEVLISADSEDVGKLIGKNGNMINALKTILNGCKAKDGNSYKLQVISR
jgi:predicted RNA-binding protein YlqC (UPF0109 family)